MTKQDKALLKAILRTDFESFLRRCYATLNPGAPYLPNWHIRAIIYALICTLNGKTTRLIVNLPPRYLKSMIVSVAWPAFVLGHQPWRRIFVISYGSELSAKHARDFLSIVHSEWYRQLFPNMQIARSAEDEVTTTARGFRKSTSVFGALTGLGGDIFIIDDPQKPIDAQSEIHRNRLNQWFSNILMSRLDNKETGKIVVVMQRVHLNDLTGYLLESSDGWTLLSLPAIALSDEQVPIGDNEFHLRRAGEPLHPEHESLATLQKQQEIIGPDAWGAQYEQTPVPPGGRMIRRQWLRYHDKRPERSEGTIIQSWDTAAKAGSQNDWSVCTTWLVVDGVYYLIDLVRDRFEFHLLHQTALALASRFEPDTILIEDASTGQGLISMLREVRHYFIKEVPVHHDKISRVYVQQAKFAAGRVFFPRDAAFLPALEAELLTFPQGKYDDQVDSVMQALAYEFSDYNFRSGWVSGKPW